MTGLFHLASFPQAEFNKKLSAKVLFIFECFLEGFAFGVNARQIELNANKLYLILPEGMEVEE